MNKTYRYISTIAKEGNMTRAAELLFVSQPALSKMVQSVENELGTQLFVRMGKKMVLTEAGKIYIDYINSMLKMEQQMRNQITGICAEKPKKILLRSPMARMPFVTNFFIPRYLQADRGLLVDFDLPDAKDDISQGDVIIRLRVEKEAVPENLAFFEVAKQERVLAVPASSPLIALAEEKKGCTYPYIEAEHLADVPFVQIVDGLKSAEFAQHYLEANKLRVTSVCTCSPESAFRLIASGAGVSLLPDIPPRHLGLEGKIRYLSVDGGDMGEKLVLRFSRKYEEDAEVNFFVKLFRKCYLEAAKGEV